jgi:hypothetical protein
MNIARHSSKRNPMPRLIIKSEGDELAVESFNLKLGVNKLGRTLDNDIRINHPGISTSHCEIRWLNDEVIVRDLNSTNGTFVNGQRIAESHLAPGQVLRVGDVEMFLDTAQAAISVPDLKEPDRGPAPKPPPGTLPCENHPASAAAYHCPECEKDFCESCVRTLKLMQGHVHKLCPLCSAHCKPIIYREKRKRRSLLEVVQHAFGMKDKGTTQKMD